MRSLITSLFVVSTLLAATVASPAMASDKSASPTSTSIESLLRDLLAKDTGGPWSLVPYRDAELKDFDLIVVEPMAPSRWHAEVELLFDFGPPPPAVLGFEPIRGGRYHLRLARDGKRLKLLRFNPVARVQPLPVSP